MPTTSHRIVWFGRLLNSTFGRLGPTFGPGFSILHNQYINHVRKAAREGKAVEVTETEPGLSRSAVPGAGLELRDLERALAKLPDEQRTIILMVGLEGMSYDTVAKIIGIPVGTVRSRLSRGREALRKLMGIVPDERAEEMMRSAA